MLDFPRWRVIMLNTLIVVSLLLALPSFLPKSWLDRVPDGVPKQTISLGLDLAGGSHILLEADTAQLARDRLESIEDSVRTAMRRAEPRIAIEGVTRTGGKLSFIVTDPAQIDSAREALLPIVANSVGGRDWTIEVTDGNRISLNMAENGKTTAIEQEMN